MIQIYIHISVCMQIYRYYVNQCNILRYGSCSALASGALVCVYVCVGVRKRGYISIYISIFICIVCLCVFKSANATVHE